MDISLLKNILKDHVVDLPYPFPYPAKVENPAYIKVIVLGCDPGNFSNTDGTTAALEYVFGITGEGKDGRYFAPIIRNLKELGLSLQDIYVQNLCRNYFTKETSKNPVWMEAAKIWKPYLKKELDTLFPPYVPVFLTSEKIYHALINDERYSPAEIYAKPELVPFRKNFLQRHLVPLYRHHKYTLKNHIPYKNRILQLLNN